MADNNINEKDQCSCGGNCTCENRKNDEAAETKNTCESKKEKEEKDYEEKDREDISESDKKTAGEPESDREAANSDEEKEESEESSDAKYMRLMADFQNFKRRAEKEKRDIYAYANERLALGILEVIDNFERALEHESTDKAYAEGMELILKQLTEVLGKSGIEEIKTIGEDFDPNFHNAVMMEENPDFESGKVTAVLQKGYILNGKVIRPSMVKVNREDI